MRFTKLTLHNFKSHENTEIDFTHMRVVAITGRNGRGKTSILDGILFALFGAGALDASKRVGSLIREGQREMMVTLEFSVGGKVYRIRRGRRPSGAQLYLDQRVENNLEVFGEGEFTSVDNGDGTESAFRSLTLATADDTQGSIERIVGGGKETILRSTFVRQGDGARFSSADPAERKDTLVRALDLKQYEPWAQTARDTHRERQAEIDTLVGKHDALAERVNAHDDEIVSKAEVSVQAAQAGLDTTVTGAAELTERIATARVAAAAGDQARQIAKSKRAEATEARSNANQLEAEASRAANAANANGAQVEQRDQLAATQVALVDLDPLEKAAQDLSDTLGTKRQKATVAASARAAHAVALRQCTQADASLLAAAAGEEQAVAALDAFDQTSAPCCPTCAQEVKGEAHATARAALESTVTKAREEATAKRTAHEEAGAAVTAAAAEIPTAAPTPEEIAALELELQTARASIATARTGNSTHHGIAQRLAQLDAAAAQQPALDEAKASARARADAAAERAVKLEGEANDADANASDDASTRIQSLEMEKAQLDLQKAAWTQKLQDEQQALTRAQAAQEAISAARTDLDGIGAALSAARLAVARSAALVDAFGRDGIPKMMLRLIKPQLERDANELLRKYNSRFIVRLDLERVTKDGKLVDALDITLLDDGTERPYEALSGGEKTRVNQALRTAIARVQAHRGGAPIESLVFDEPEGLDDEGFTAMCDIIKGASEEFGLVLTVTHGDGLAAACDTVLKVTGVQDGETASRVQVVA